MRVLDHARRATGVGALRARRGLPKLRKLRKPQAGRQLIGPMILPGFMMLSGSSAFLIERISDTASPCSS